MRRYEKQNQAKYSSLYSCAACVQASEEPVYVFNPRRGDGVTRPVPTSSSSRIVLGRETGQFLVAEVEVRPMKIERLCPTPPVPWIPLDPCQKNMHPRSQRVDWSLPRRLCPARRAEQHKPTIYKLQI